VTRIVDFHSHLIPGVDDGSRTVDQSISSLQAMAAQGMTTCVTTPHFDASLTRNAATLAQRLGEIDAAWARLGEALATRSGLPQLPQLLRGTEVMLDEPEVDLSDPRIRLNGGRFILCEFPGMRFPPNAEWGISNLVSQGWQPIVTHPERYRNLDPRLRVLARLREAGAVFQVNAGSLTGLHGEPAMRTADRILALGWAEYLSSDFHARGVPATLGAIKLLHAQGAKAQATRLTEENPARMLAGEDPLPVAPHERPKDEFTWLQRLLGSRAKG
jgi:protein-tyrosine phosphatase